MRENNMRSLVVVICLLASVCVGMAYVGYAKSDVSTSSTQAVAAKTGNVSLTGQLSQDKIFMGGNGLVSMQLTLTADEKETDGLTQQGVDLVIVLDRSGSMGGEKIEYARRAVTDLISGLGPRDRFALVSYSSDVIIESRLTKMSPSAREKMIRNVNHIIEGGGTNLGDGLKTGMNLLADSSSVGNQGRLILISDGRANEGIVDPVQLGEMASGAGKHEFVITTVGVGMDYNEYLMSAISDRGMGNYYFMESPESFAEVFAGELRMTRAVAATNLEISIPLENGVRLVDASGYPVEIRNNVAVFRPGSLLSGQTRKMFLTLSVPSHAEGTTEINGIALSYASDGKTRKAALTEPLMVACVNDREAAMASIDSEIWEQQVIQDEFNLLREQVAQDIDEGNEEAAMAKIAQYESEKYEANKIVGSSAVAQNLQQDVGQLRDTVSSTLAPGTSSVEKKRAAKTMQAESYDMRRAKSKY